MGLSKADRSRINSQNGAKGGRPTSMMTELRRKAREKATRLISDQQEESVRFLIYVRDNPNAELPQRVRCALELLDRGDMIKRTGLGVSADETFDVPKMFGILKFGGDRPKHEPPAHADGGETNGDGDGV